MRNLTLLDIAIYVVIAVEAIVLAWFIYEPITNQIIKFLN